MRGAKQCPQKGVGRKEQRKAIKKERVASPLSHAMKYQLVLQFRGDSLSDFDAMVALEDELTEELKDLADVDGHDFGSGEMNIFIFTADPTATFKRVRPVLERRQQLQSVTAAFREADGEQFAVIWPEGSRKKFRVI